MVSVSNVFVGVSIYGILMEKIRFDACGGVRASRRRPVRGNLRRPCAPVGNALPSAAPARSDLARQARRLGPSPFLHRVDPSKPSAPAMQGIRSCGSTCPTSRLAAASDRSKFCITYHPYLVKIQIPRGSRCCRPLGCLRAHRGTQGLARASDASRLA